LVKSKIVFTLLHKTEGS